jgi:CheY-like chemotaxis protein
MTEAESALILIVDDDYDFLEINRLVLERAGYRVLTAAEPKQALVLMEKQKPDLVITDLMMTSLDSGFLFARAIKEDPRYAGIPVVIATSVSSALGLDFRPRTDEERANMHVDAYFDKPLDRARLLATIAELLAQATAAGPSRGAAVAPVGDAAEAQPSAGGQPGAAGAAPQPGAPGSSEG